MVNDVMQNKDRHTVQLLARVLILFQISNLDIEYILAFWASHFTFLQKKTDYRLGRIVGAPEKIQCRASKLTLRGLAVRNKLLFSNAFVLIGIDFVEYGNKLRI